MDSISRISPRASAYFFEALRIIGELVCADVADSVLEAVKLVGVEAIRRRAVSALSRRLYSSFGIPRVRVCYIVEGGMLSIRWKSSEGRLIAEIRVDVWSRKAAGSLGEELGLARSVWFVRAVLRLPAGTADPARALKDAPLISLSVQ